jgi:hypothetical protein
MKTFARAKTALFGTLVVAVSCMRAPSHPPPAAISAPRVLATASTPAPLPAPIALAPAPPPHITLPMAGDPDGAALGEARLSIGTCTESQRTARERVRREIEAMRTAVDAEFESWRSLPPCWPAGGPKGGESFGAGGLGLSGVGEGGGGLGEGIGLGSVGTIGHGAWHAKSASGTNNQVAGVDEADIVKNDGAYVYLALNGALRIAEAMNPHMISVTKLPGAAKKMVVDGDRAVVFVAIGTTDQTPSSCTYGYDCSFAGDGSHTKVIVFDVADRTHPKVVRVIDLSGSLMTARRIGATVHAVVADNDSPEPTYDTTPENIPFCRMNEPIVRAMFEQLKRKNEQTIRAAALTFPTLKDQGVTRKLCDVMRTPLADGEAFTSVVSFDMRDDKTAPKTATVQSRPGAVFASEDGLYLSVTHRKGDSPKWYGFYASQNEISDIHKFRIGVTPAETRYVGSGAVPGHVLNQFAMDEWYGYLRVATTRGRVPAPDVESAVSVLAEGAGGNLVRVGAINHIAPSEDIRAVRFDDDRGYVVTFKKTDPLFVVDLHDPAAPKILGELKIPGFSTYLHRIDPAHLLSIGFDANDHGNFAYFDGVILQIFDVTNPVEPVLLHKEKIGTRGSSSAAATDHLAFNYFAERKLLALPMTICEGGGDGTFGDRLSFSGLLVYDVTVENGFRRLGGVDHGTRGANCNTWWSHADSSVKRSIFMDDLVFSIATDRMKVQRMGHFGEDVAVIALGP